MIRPVLNKVHVDASKGYDVVISNGILNSCGDMCREVLGQCKVMIISDNIVYQLYGNIVKNSFEKAGFETCVYTFTNGEQSKNTTELVKILEKLAENHLTRSDVVIALGGGVTGDMAGFAAASYLRGIRFVQIPTTFLAAVDSSVGGKTGVNLTNGKNLVGAFHQPSLVVCDPSVFETLSREEFSNGVSEAIKCGMIIDSELFEMMSENFDVQKVIARCVEIKSRVVALDEFDEGTRQLLNFGHTLGHAIEKCSEYKIQHGAAVAIGMAYITKAAEKNSFCKQETYKRLVSVLEKCGLPIKCDFELEALFDVILSDKKRSGNAMTVVLPKKIGKCTLCKMSITEFYKFLEKGI